MMIFIRSLLLWMYFILWTIPYAVGCFLIFPLISPHRRYWVAAGWCHTTMAVLRVVNGIRFMVKGSEYLPDGPAVLLSKHQSAWETLAFPALMPRPLCYVLKRELLWLPFFGWTLGLLKMIFIDRSRGRRAFGSMKQQSKLRLADGAWIMMFPEGTRTPVGKSGHYKSGGARLAVEMGAPVVPIAHNAGHLWPRHSFLKFPGLVTVSIGQPINTIGLSADEVNRRVEQWIEGEMRRIDPTAYPDTHDDVPRRPRSRPAQSI